MWSVALHVGNILPAGKVGITSGTYDTNADSLRITIYGKGGHGAAPQTAIDPIVIAARTILALQTIVSREVKPGEMAVITVGYIQAGTKNNIIPDQAEMGLTVRTYKAEVRKQLLAAIARITKAEAEAAAAPREPLIEHYEATDSVYNDPALARRLRGALESTLGQDNVEAAEPVTTSEDFSFFVEQGIPGFYFSLGGADPQRLAEAVQFWDDSALESLLTVRPGCGSRAAHGNRGGSGCAEEFAAGIGGGVAEVDRRKVTTAARYLLRSVSATSAQRSPKISAERVERGLYPLPDLSQNGARLGGRISRCCDRPSYHDVAGASGNGFGGSDHAHLVTVPAAGWAHAGGDDSKIVA